MKTIRTFETFEEAVKRLSKAPPRELTQADIDSIAQAVAKRERRKDKRKNAKDDSRI